MKAVMISALANEKETLQGVSESDLIEVNQLATLIEQETQIPNDQKYLIVAMQIENFLKMAQETQIRLGVGKFSLEATCRLLLMNKTIQPSIDSTYSHGISYIRQYFKL